MHGIKLAYFAATNCGRPALIDPSGRFPIPLNIQTCVREKVKESGKSGREIGREGGRGDFTSMARYEQHVTL